MSEKALSLGHHKNETRLSIYHLPAHSLLVPPDVVLLHGQHVIAVFQFLLHVTLAQGKASLKPRSRNYRHSLSHEIRYCDIPVLLSQSYLTISFVIASLWDLSSDNLDSTILLRSLTALSWEPTYTKVK